MNVFMGYNPLVGKQVKISTFNTEADGEDPTVPFDPEEGDCVLMFANAIAEEKGEPIAVRTFNGTSWVEPSGGGGGGGVVIPEVTLTLTSQSAGTYTSTVPFEEMAQTASRYENKCPLAVAHDSSSELVIAEYFADSQGALLGFDLSSLGHYTLYDDGTWESFR